MPVSVKKIQPAFLASSVHKVCTLLFSPSTNEESADHQIKANQIMSFQLQCGTKWLRAQPGTSLVYVSEQVRESWIPLDLHGRSRDIPGGTNWDAGKDVMGPTGYPEKFFKDARKFDSGGKPNPIFLPMLRASLEQVSLVDRDEAQETLKVLMDPLVSWARDNGYKVPCEPRAYHIVGIEPPDRTTEEILAMAKKLKENGIIVAVRCGGFRISPCLDTTPSDIQKLIQALESPDTGVAGSCTMT
jgi:selenocysteine lyase/cysteine desulfurase